MKTKSDYQNMKEWRQLAYMGAGLSLSLIIGVIIIFETAVKQRDLAYKEVETYKSALNVEINKHAAREAAKQAEKETEWNRFIEALIFVESSGDSQAVGDGGKAVGVLQIHPSWIEDVNAVGYHFALNDRYDRGKSIAIFNAYHDIYNPERNIERAIHLHNPGAGVAYRDRIINQMNQLKN